MFVSAVRKPFLATVVFASVLSTLPASAQSDAMTLAGTPVSGAMSTQDILQAGLTQPAPPSAPVTAPVAEAQSSPASRHSVSLWALTAWVSVGVILAFGYLLRRRVW